MIKKILILFFCLGFYLVAYSAEFEIPSSRYVSLVGETGLDSVGGIPSGGWSNCTNTACNTLYGSAPGSVTASMINSAISGAPNDTVVRLPAGSISISGNISLNRSRVVLRGQGPSSTTIDLNGNQVAIENTLPCDGTALGSCSQRINIENEPISKGATSVIADTVDGDFSSISAGDVCLLFSDRPSYVYGSETYMGWEPDGSHTIGHWVEVTNVNGGTGEVTFDPALLFDLEAGLDPEIFCIDDTDWYYNVGLEDLKLTDGGNSIGLIWIEGARYSWIKNIETENAGNGSDSCHIRTYAANFRVEIRDSYFHGGESPTYTSGENYGMYLSGFQSFLKIENNIIHDVRHTIVFQGPTAGTAVLYNYDHSHRQDDGDGQYDYLGESMLNNHGHHPLNNLWEGNYTTRYGSDNQFGSSSNATWFRNYARGNKPLYAWTWGQWTVDIWQHQFDLNFVGNVLGNDADFDPGDYYQNDAGGEFMREPAIWQIGGDGCCSFGNADTKNSLLRHMNYDYVTEGTRVCTDEDEGCQGGTAGNTDLPDSLYYTVEPSWWNDQSDSGKCRPWPPIDPVAPTITDIPAKDIYESETYSGDACEADSSIIKKIMTFFRRLRG